MGLNYQIINLRNIVSDKYTRLDTKYRTFSDKMDFNVWHTTNTKPLDFYISLIHSQVIKKGKLPKKYPLIDLKSIERKTNTLINISHVNEIGSDKIIIKDGDIIIPKIEPKKGQLFLNLNHKQFIGSTELMEYTINSNLIKPKFLYYLLVQTKTLKGMSYLESGKTHRRVQPIDLLKIKIPNIPLTIQNKTIVKIEPLENEIKTLKTQKKADLESINKVFSETFNIELEEIKKLDKVKRFNLSLQEVMLKNDALRTSFKWHKLEQIQSYMYKNINSITKLSTVILNTKNGWSPESSEVEEGTAVLGQEHILKNGKISLNPSKYTTLSRNNIENFYVKKNDFFVSRGNTLELVAMAGVVNQEVFDNILYPDLYIKVEFKESKVHKQYMAYLFNSFIGRVYFNHVAKGKNQTMVKVSSKEILDFYLPLPSMEIQEKIVKQIKEEIDIQKEIDNKILERQDAINALIEACIKQEQGQ